MTPQRRERILVGVMIVLLAIAALWVWQWRGEQRALANRDATNLTEVKLLAERIEAMRAEPAVAATEDLELKELGGRLEAAAGKARFPQGAIEGVLPRSARRFGDTAYLEKPTEIDIRGVTLTQLAAFLHHVANDAGLTVRDLRLRTPRGDAPTNTWNADATLTYLLYAPIERARPGGQG